MFHFYVIVCHHQSTSLYISKHKNMSLYFYENYKMLLKKFKFERDFVLAHK